jgi:hypothetical protein
MEIGTYLGGMNMHNGKQYYKNNLIDYQGILERDLPVNVRTAPIPSLKGGKVPPFIQKSYMPKKNRAEFQEPNFGYLFDHHMKDQRTNRVFLTPNKKIRMLAQGIMKLTANKFAESQRLGFS